MIPYVLRERVNLRFDTKDIVAGVAVSAIVLLPFWFLLSQPGRSLPSPSVSTMLFQVLGAAFPEEVYFRGFLQEQVGNNVRGLLVVSLLFSIMHLPQLIFYGDPYAILTFFPSLVMGFLYMWTSNVIPSTIFHAAANTLFVGLL